MSDSQAEAAPGAAVKKQTNLGMVVAASSSGTVFEWYDFFIFGIMATIVAKHFFTGLTETAALIAALLTFAIGLAVRPLGAIVFGALGDTKGRKNTFLITISMMGLSTFAIGFLPDYNQIGIWAPISLLALRVLQGFALGGEYGGAVIYVAEHAPEGKRGYFTGWVQTAASLGLTLALLVILGARTAIGEEAFASWGWRIPFLVSLVLLGISLWVRAQLGESPVFKKMKDEGEQAKAPLGEVMKWPVLKIMILSLLGPMMAQGVNWYFVHFYLQTFLERLLKIPAATVNIWLMIVVICSTPLYIFFAWLSDKVGRKPIILFGMITSAVTFFPGFHIMAEYGNPALTNAQKNAPIVVYADPAQCSLQFDPVGKTAFSTSCDIAKSQLSNGGISYDNLTAPAGTVAEVRIGNVVVPSVEGRDLDKDALKAAKADFDTRMKAALKSAGYPEGADPARINHIVVVGVFLIFIIAATSVYGPLGMLMIELFPARVRYTALSIPYHIGTGVFGGFVSSVAFATVAATGNIYSGAYFPVIITTISILVTFFLIPETKDRPLGHS